MDKRTIEQLDAALNAVSQDLSPRVEEIVRLNDTLSLLKLQAEEFWSMRAAS
jgi:hypothetical protein